ncbi:MAG: M48 family metallopeptidase, partial [Gammaproteobacteria bacterium]
ILRRALAMGGVMVLFGVPSEWLYAGVVDSPCAAEVKRANDTLSKIFRQWPLRATGESVTQSAQAVANQLALRAGEQTHRRWRIHVIRDSKLNAFSIGDGHVFVTEGMLRFVASEDELAAVLAHEFAHHVAGHFCQSRGGFLKHLFNGSDRTVATVGTLSASIDPTKEREADRIGAIIMERGGYNPRAAVLLAARMAGTGTPAHFQYGQRIEALQAQLADKPPASWDAETSAAFTRMKTALLDKGP